MKARDAATVAALRSALSAIDNAEAVDAGEAPPPDAVEGVAAGAVVGVRAAEVERQALTETQVEEIVRAEVAERQAAASDYQRREQPAQAERLRREAAALRAYLGEEG